MANDWQKILNLAKIVSDTQGESICLDDGSQRLSFLQLADESSELANTLMTAGVGFGRMTGLALSNSAAFPIALLALLKSGCSIALVSPRYRRQEWQGIIDKCGMDFVLAEQETSSLLSDFGNPDQGQELSVPNSSRECKLITLVSLNSKSALHRKTACLVKFTSGTTGVPKAVQLTPRNLMAAAENMVRSLNLEYRDVILAVSPLCHSYAFDLGVLPMLTCGCQLSLIDGFIPRRILKMLTGGNISVFLGVPAVYRLLLKSRQSHETGSIGVTRLLSCTESLDPNTIRLFHERFGAAICQHYGSSESGGATLHENSAILNRPTSVGRSIQGVDISIVDEAGEVIPAGREGEVVIRSEAVSPGYLYGAETTSGRLTDGAYFTGDRGHLDSDGFLFLSGRVDDLMNVGGNKVSATEITEALESHPMVDCARVREIPSDQGGITIVADVEVSAAVTEDELLEYSRSLLADYKVPRRLEIHCHSTANRQERK